MSEIKLSPALEKYDLASPPSRYSVYLPLYGNIDLVTITEEKIQALIARGCTYFVPKIVVKESKKEK